jgi:hypothetical protein
MKAVRRLRPQDFSRGVHAHRIFFAAEEQRERADVLLSNTMDVRMSSYPHLASAALVAAFFMAMLVTANRFTEYRSMKVQAIGVVQVRGLPL